jgi:hypothetical protein
VDIQLSNRDDYDSSVGSPVAGVVGVVVTGATTGCLLRWPRFMNCSNAGGLPQERAQHACSGDCADWLSKAFA